MVKHFNVIMAGVISGIVALFTSVLGVSGTIIGSVLSSFLYQLLSAYYEEKVDGSSLRKPKLANEIVYIFPLVVIGIIELIFLFSALHYRFDMIFGFLESAVANNLFRLMGIGLILLGAYPFFNSNDIDKRNGLILLVVGVLLLLRGLMDISEFGVSDDLAFCEWLAREVGVGAVPGSSFFKEPVNNYIRFHFAKKDETLKAALERLADVFRIAGVRC